MSEQNNSPNEFDIFKLLKQHIKDKKNSSKIEYRLCEIERSIIKDVELLKISLSSAELKQTVVRRIKEKIKYIKDRHTYWHDAKKAVACFVSVFFLLSVFLIFGNQTFDLFIDSVRLSKNRVLSHVNISEKILLFLGLLAIIIKSKLIDIIAEGIYFIWNTSSVQVLEGLEECISLLEMQEDIVWVLKKQSQDGNL